MDFFAIVGPDTDVQLTEGARRESNHFNCINFDFTETLRRYKLLAVNTELQRVAATKHWCIASV